MKVVAFSDELFPFWNKFITINNDCIFQQSFMGKEKDLRHLPISASHIMKA